MGIRQRGERRKGERIRARMTALVWRGRRPRAIVLQVLELAVGGARCRAPVPLRVGATFPVELVLTGKWTRERPRVLQAYCRVVWATCRIGPSRPVQELGLAFRELSPEAAALLRSLLRAETAA